jgi:hypothetical protein
MDRNEEGKGRGMRRRKGQEGRRDRDRNEKDKWTGTKRGKGRE